MLFGSRTDIQPKQLSADEIEAMWILRKLDISKLKKNPTMIMATDVHVLAQFSNREYAQTWTWLRNVLCRRQIQARALLMQIAPWFLDHSLDYLKQLNLYIDLIMMIWVLQIRNTLEHNLFEQGAYVQSLSSKYYRQNPQSKFMVARLIGLITVSIVEGDTKKC